MEYPPRVTKSKRRKISISTGFDLEASVTCSSDLVANCRKSETASAASRL